MNKNQLKKVEQKKRRIGRVRAKISGTPEKPRLAIHRSLRYISAQLIDDVNGKTLAAVHQRDLKKKMKKAIKEK